MITAILKDVIEEQGRDKSYSMDELRRVCEVTDVEGGCFLCVCRPDDLLVSFLLCEFESSKVDGTETRCTIVFEGEAPSGNLREMRHIYWGPDGCGYTFYLPTKSVVLALTKLNEFFDF